MFFNYAKILDEDLSLMRVIFREESPIFSIEDLLKELPQGLYMAENFEEDSHHENLEEIVCGVLPERIP